MTEYSDEEMRSYLLGKLDPDAEQKLEEELAHDPELAEALTLQRDILIGIKEGFDEQLKDKLAKVSLDETGKVRRLPLWRWASAAAIILGSLGIYFYMTQTTSTERLYASYFKGYPNIIAPGQRDEGGRSAFNAYDAERWEDALEEFESLAEDQPAAIYPIFYQGLIYLHLEKWEEAIVALEMVGGGSDVRFIDPAAWYVALAYLRTGAHDRALLVLELIADDQSNYRHDAQSLINELD